MKTIEAPLKQITEKIQLAENQLSKLKNLRKSLNKYAVNPQQKKIIK